ncbi:MULTISPECIES: hypothetical protein [Pandoraea]|nr:MULTISPECIES: hypothetical protein [Pandoraea]
MIKTATTRFESELKRASVQQHLVGVYDQRARLEDVTADLREHVR